MHLPAAIQPYLQPYLAKLSQHRAKLYPLAAASLFFIGTILILMGIFFSRSNSVQARTPQTSSIPNFKKADTPQESSTKSIIVDVSGAVTKPGLYSFNEGDRLSSALEAAGGLDSNVNKNFVEHSLNLSQKLTDEQKIYIPFNNEREDAIAVATSNSASGSKTTPTLINVNTASQAELETLTGIGAVRAQNIISGRPFKSLQELVQKGSMTQKIFNDNKEKIKI